MIHPHRTAPLAQRGTHQVGHQALATARLGRDEHHHRVPLVAGRAAHDLGQHYLRQDRLGPVVGRIGRAGTRQRG